MKVIACVLFYFILFPFFFFFFEIIEGSNNRTSESWAGRRLEYCKLTRVHAGKGKDNNNRKAENQGSRMLEHSTTSGAGHRISGLENRRQILECQQGSSNNSTVLLGGVGVEARVGGGGGTEMILNKNRETEAQPGGLTARPPPFAISSCCQGTRWAARNTDHISALMSRRELAGPLGPPEWGRLGAHGGEKQGEPRGFRNEGGERAKG